MPDAPPYAAQGDPERSRLYEEWRESKGEGGAPVAQGQVFSGSSPALPTDLEVRPLSSCGPMPDRELSPARGTRANAGPAQRPSEALRFAEAKAGAPVEGEDERGDAEALLERELCAPSRARSPPWLHERGGGRLVSLCPMNETSPSER